MFGTWRFDCTSDKETLTQQPVDPTTPRPHVMRACQSCREKKIRCSSDKSGCARCKTLSKPCVYQRWGEGKRSSRKRDEGIAANRAISYTNGNRSPKRRATTSQRDKLVSPDEPSTNPTIRQAHSAGAPDPAMLPLAAWSTLGFVAGDIGSIVIDPPSAHSLDGPQSVARDLSPRREDDNETTGARHETTTTAGHWSNKAAGGPTSLLEISASFSPPWFPTGQNQVSDGLASSAAPFPTEHHFEVSLLNGLPTPKSMPQANDTGSAQPPFSEPAQDRPCLCLQHIAFLVHELESTTTKHLDAGLSMHKEALSFAESMLLCVRCSRRPENLTLLTFLSERLLRLGERVARIFIEATMVPVSDRPAMVFGEYEVDSPLEWELVLCHLIAQQLNAHKRLARNLKAAAETLGCESVCGKAKQVGEQAAELVERLLLNATSIRSSLAIYH